jgi:uncharacterized membrane protein YjgN (DUF898 family)
MITSRERLDDTTSPTKENVNLRMAFHGQGLDFFILVLKTTLLTIATLGLYYPWSRCQRLNYLYRNTTIGNHNLLFHGTGWEIAVGYIKALTIYGFAYGLFLYSQSLAESIPALAALIFLAFTMITFGLSPAAVWGGRSYRASRLSYRGIRFGMEKSRFKSFYFKSIRDIILIMVTLGLYSPFALYGYRKRINDASLWGNQNLEFAASRKESVILSLTNFFLTIFSLGLLSPVAFIRRTNFNLRKISIQNVELRSDLKWIDGYVITIMPLIVSTLSLGLLYPWAMVFATSHFYSKITLVGQIDLSSILQGQNMGNALGETASSLLDFDTGLGV